MSRFVKPETVRVDLSDGDWLLLKRQLTAGEMRALFTRLLQPIATSPGELMSGHDAALRVDATQASLGTILAYLVDWSFTDDEGRPVVVRGQAPEIVASILDNLSGDAFAEVWQAVEAHEVQQRREREARKANPTGAGASQPISASAE
jgi:hypothetical protein